MGIVVKPKSFQKEELNLDYFNAKPILTLDTPKVKEPLHFNFNDNKNLNPLTQPNSNLYLQNPENIKTDLIFDPKTGNYNIKQKVGNSDYRPETYLNLKEYKEYVFKKQMREYFRSRLKADELNENPRKGIIPPLKVNSELFDRIFGGNTIDIKPTGMAELVFGLNTTKQLNPIIPQRQQKITNFDFNMRIQLNLIGKIGDKLKITTNYNTEASFDWENQVKMDYTGYEDEILKKIEAGNVTLPLNSSLISGSQTLFGLKTELQFGKLKATTVFSQQKGKKQEITVQGGAQTTPFNLSADNYEQNKHYFLGHYFLKNYDKWMNTLPVISTPIIITKVEIYLLGINGSAEQTRNIVAFEDLGEDLSEVELSMKDPILISPSNFAIADNIANDDLPSNKANNLYQIMTDTLSGLLKNRNIDEVSGILSSPSAANIINQNNDGGAYMLGSRDYNVIRNARRLNPNEYYLNPRTGYISLNQQLNNEQSLAISYQYTYNGKLYNVGEFSDQVPSSNKLIICKLLKTNSVSVKHPMWKLMMKNVYAIGAYNLNSQDFKLDVYYNNVETGIDMPYLPFGKVNGVQLIKVLDCDKLSVNGDKNPDGVYDFINGYTVSQNNGRVYFPTVEPFGKSLEKKFDAVADFPEASTKYIFNELYDSTKTAASFIQNKNRFKIKGTYRSSSGSDIALNALNIPQGAVIVTANGVALAENTDFTVDYTLGRVKIINEGILNSGATIKVSIESNSLFTVQQKSLWGTRLDYKAGRNLTLGSTFLRFNERPMTQKVSIGDEPVTNYILGLDFAYKTDAPLLTRLIDKLPFYSTKEMSSINTRGEFAKLFPGNAAAISKSGNSYIDDFEGSISLIDIRSPNAWHLSSVPQGQPSLFPEAIDSRNINPGINRARINWYNIDPMFTRNQSGTSPTYYEDQKLFSNNMWRQVFETELFPGKTPPNGQQVMLPLLDIGFYPNDRGPYNYDVLGSNFSSGISSDGKLKSPESRWGGIMRRLETNDFQAANIEYIQFWMMDPFNEDYKLETDSAFDKNQLPSGDLYINLGNMSEDIVKDGRMVYENGLRGTSIYSKDHAVDTNAVAIVPLLAPTINAFSQDQNDRPFQDVGYDGMNDESERWRFSNYLSQVQSGGFDQNAPAIKGFLGDPSSDKYHFFRGDDYDNIKSNTLQRYSKYNNPEGNSPTESQYQNLNPNGGNYPTGSTTIPDIEDINKDNTLNESENYYQYHIKVSPNDISPNSIGANFIVDAFNGTAQFSGVTKTVKWYQFKIPISQFEKAVGGIESFNSIRFMRVFMKGFNRPVLLRMARFELVRSDWRRYQFDLKQPGEYLAVDANSSTFDVSAVSLLENANKIPVNYVMPPEISQQQNVQTTNLVLQNEQALQIRVCDLKDGDSRAIFKNVDLDTRMFKNIKMNVHAEKLNEIPLNDGDLTLFYRIGSDYNNNFYEYEVPLKITPKGVYDQTSTDARYAVWPKENEINFKFEEDIAYIKTSRNNEYGYFSNLNQLSKPYSLALNGYTVSIVGNPNLGNVKSIMVGIRNKKGTDNLAHCAEIWINELRLTDFNNEGGWATTGQVQAKLADLGMVSLAGTYKTPFWGGVESKINERTKETNFNWDMTSSINAGKFFSDKLKITLPLFYNFGQTKIIPLFNPLDPDVLMSAFNNIPIPDSTKSKIKDQIIDYTERKGFNISNFRIDGLKRKKAKPMPLDISNFSATYAYNENFKRSINIEYNINKQYRGNLQYSYSFKNPIVFKPFSKIKLFENKWFTLIKDFSFQLTPNSFGASIDLSRTYVALKNRDVTSFYAGSNDFFNPTLINKNFTLTRSYNFRWDINKSIKYDYTASNDGRILEPYGEVFKENKTNTDSIINVFFNGKNINGKTQGKYGENNVFRQAMNLNVDIPINKIPIFDFIKSTYRYSGTYTWNRRPFAADDNIGNTIQNTSSHNITGNFNLTNLYNKIPYFKKVNNPQSKQSNNQINLDKGNSDLAKKVSTPPKNQNFKDIFEFLAKGIMMVKNVSVTFQQLGGQSLSNFIPSSQYGGMDFSAKQAPGFLFTTGLFDDNIRQNSAKNNWLTQNSNITTPYTEIFNRNYTYKASVEPHGSLRIELNGNYSLQKNSSAYILYEPNNPLSLNGFLFNGSPNETGNFNISTFTFFRSFKDGNDPIKSNLYNEFLTERFTIAKELGAANPYSTGPKTNSGITPYVDGYSNNQQDVMIASFYRVYTGQNIKNYSTKNIFPTIPLPNWTLNWDGIGKIKQLKKTFSKVTVRHGYSSSYNVSGFNNNLFFNEDGKTQSIRKPVAAQIGQPNFESFYNINSVTIREAFSPLLKLDFQFNKPGWSANIENKRDKTTTLNISGFQIIETKGQEYILGLGYRVQKLKINWITIQGKPLESPLTVRVDFSFRKNISVIRRIYESTSDDSQPSAGTNIYNLSNTIDYQLTPNINFRIFYTWIKTTPQTSASFPTANSNGGFTIRINFQ